MRHRNCCKFSPNADRTRYSGVTTMRKYYNDCDICNNLYVNIIQVNERDPWVRCGFCSPDGLYPSDRFGE